MLYNDECYAAFYSVVDLGGFLCWACKEKHWKEAEVILQYLTSRGVGIGCGGELQWGILTKNWTQTTLWLLYLVHRTYTVCRYIKDILRCGRNGNGKKKNILARGGMEHRFGVRNMYIWPPFSITFDKILFFEVWNSHLFRVLSQTLAWYVDRTANISCYK